MDYAVILAAIENQIVPNANNEITADVLRPILIDLLNFTDETVGDLTDLSTSDNSNIVSAVNELKSAIDNINEVVFLTGMADPNVTPPPTYEIGDFYIQLDGLNNPINLYIYNGVEWFRFGAPNLEEVIAQGGNIGVSQLFNDGNGLSPYATLDDLSDELEGYIKIDPTPATSQTFVGDLKTRGVFESFAVSGSKTRILQQGVGFTQTGSSFEGILTPSTSFTAARNFYLPDASGTVALKEQVDALLTNKADLVGGLVPASQLPSYVDDVLEFANFAAFPVTGDSGKIYVALDTNLTYRWGGSSYVEISPSLALGETSSTAYRGDRGKIAYDHSQTTGNPHNTQITDISGLSAAINSKANISGSNATGTWPISITGNSVTAIDSANWLPTDVGDFNTGQGGKFTLLRALQNAANRPGNGQYGTGIRLNTAANPNFNTDIVSDVTGALYTRVQAGGAWGDWVLIPFDNSLLHKEGDETKNGSLTFQGNGKGIYLGVSGQNASILYNSNGNLDITPRSGYNTIFTAGNVGIGTGDTPSAKLHVVGSSLFVGDVDINNSLYYMLRLRESGNLKASIGQGDYAVSGGNGAMLGVNGIGGVQLSAGTNICATIHTTGNMSIGSAVDSGYKLDVNGTGRFVGQLTIPLTPSSSTDAASKGYVDTATVAVRDTITVSMPATNANDYSSVSGISITGAQVGDFVQINTNLAYGGNILFHGRVTAADTVTVYRFNGSTSNITGTTSITMKIKLTR